MFTNNFKNKKISVFAAHPDDELLGAGATFAKLIDQNIEVHAFILCEGESIRYKNNNNISLYDCAKEAASIIGFSSIKFIDLPDQRLDSLSLIEINKKIETILDNTKPDIIFTHFEGDINRDHRILNESIMVASRPFGRNISEVYAFETPSATGLWNRYNFNPDTFVVVDDFIDTKIKALECYESEILEYPHPRSRESIKSRAKYWGSLVNKHHVEPFVTHRRIFI